MEAPAPANVPADVRRILETLWSDGHAAYLVGGGVRDALLDRPVTDWDVATDALPENTMALFPGSGYTNRFGTVTVPSDPTGIEVTTFRRDHRYADHRRPDSVTFTDSLDEDLARRNFTVNAIAWGRGASEADGKWIDPTGGMDDLRAGVLRAVGDPNVRFDEDALRLLRAARRATQLGFEIEPATRAAMAATADTARWVSSERIGGELRKMIAADPPSRAFEILAEAGVLEHSLPELAAQRGVPQDKATGHDLWGHCMATLDAAAAVDRDNQSLRLAALLHDIGKPPTFADGHFIGHDEEGAKMAEAMLTRLAYPRQEIVKVAALIRNHMFSYEPRWSSAAVRRFIRRTERELVDELIMLRRADNIGSGQAVDAGHLGELATRVAAELEAGSPLSLRELAIDGNDLVNGLGLKPGPKVGELLERLLGSVIADPTRNTREQLLAEARTWTSAEPQVAPVIEALLQAERLMVHGMVDHAERIYSSALEQDPLNAIAVVGLARVALERGDDQLAYAHARRALEIDPQNSAALRLEARLAEVLEGERLGNREQATEPPPMPAAGSEELSSAPEVRPSERHVFTRNPSMAEHRNMEERRRATEEDQS